MRSLLFLLLTVLAAPLLYAESLDEIFQRDSVRYAKTLPEGTVCFYIAPNGCDEWSGRLAEPNREGTDGPFATFARAQKGVRQLRQEKTLAVPVAISVEDGDYFLEEPISLTAEDSGTSASPTIWRAEHSRKVRLCGGRVLEAGTPVTDPEILSQFSDEVRGKILQYDLKKAGIDDYGIIAKNRVEVFDQNRPLTLARYPNEGFIRIADVEHEGTTPIEIHGNPGIAEAQFYVNDERPARWQQEKEPWVLGYWFWDWAETHQKIDAYNPETKKMTLKAPNDTYGYRKNQWFYAYNLLCEIDQPGEYYIDSEKGVLYYYPLSDTPGELLVTKIDRIIQSTDASHLIFSGFLLDGCRDTAMVVTGADSITIYDSEIRNVSRDGIDANGKNLLICGCDLSNMGRAAIQIVGGDRTTLESSQDAVVNNSIHHYARIKRTYAAGIRFDGVGHYIANNKITDAPHCAILFGGNDNLIERNEIARVCLESNDAGAIYCGRNWTMRGNCVKNNFLHDIDGFEHKGCVGVYLDDMFSSCDMIGNLFVKVTRATMIGGGRDNTIANNIYLDCEPSVHVDGRALNWCSAHTDGWIQEAKEKGTILGIRWNQPPYSTRYPKLATILDEEPKAPRGTVVRDNVIVGGTAQPVAEGEVWKGEGDSIESVAAPYIHFENNLVGVDPLFVDSTHGDYHLRPESPVLKMNFEPIPLDKIGLMPMP